MKVCDENTILELNLQNYQLMLAHRLSNLVEEIHITQQETIVVQGVLHMVSKDVVCELFFDSNGNLLESNCDCHTSFSMHPSNYDNAMAS